MGWLLVSSTVHFSRRILGSRYRFLVMVRPRHLILLGYRLNCLRPSHPFRFPRRYLIKVAHSFRVQIPSPCCVIIIIFFFLLLLTPFVCASLWSKVHYGWIVLSLWGGLRTVP